MVDLQLSTGKLLFIRRHVRSTRTMGSAAMGTRPLSAGRQRHTVFVGRIRVGQTIRSPRTASSASVIRRGMHNRRPMVRATAGYGGSAWSGREHHQEVHLLTYLLLVYPLTVILLIGRVSRSHLLSEIKKNLTFHLMVSIILWFGRIIGMTITMVIYSVAVSLPMEQFLIQQGSLLLVGYTMNRGRLSVSMGHTT